MPYSRYNNLETKVLPNGKTVYKPTIPKTVKPNFSDAEVVAGDADRFDTIAYNLYGDADKWWRIASANRLVNGTLHIPSNTTIKVPLK